MMKTEPQKTNHDKQSQVEAEFTKVLKHVCDRGFYGLASVAVSLQDGHIQNTRVTVERMIR